MSKQNNLTDFLTDVADAIREKKGTTEKINPQDFSEEIKNLPSSEEVKAFGEVMVDKTGKGVKQLLKVVIDNNVTTIGTNAYYYFDNVTDFVLHNGIKSIAVSAFAQCRRLSAITIPDSVESIGSYCFASCIALKNIIFPDKVVLLEKSVCNNCAQLESVIVKGNISRIDSYSFSGTSLRSLVLSGVDSVATLDAGALQQTPIANGTGYIYVPDNLVDAYKSATNWSVYADQIRPLSEYIYLDFADPIVEKICAKKIGDGIGVTQEQANKVTTFPAIFKGNTEITSFDELEMFENVTNLAFGAFMDCTSLKSVAFPHIKSLAGNAFLNCSSLDMDINLPSLMTLPGNRQFNKSAIRKVISLGSITSLSDAMFEYCTNLIEIVIPSTCATINVAALYGCTALQSIICNPITPPVLDSVIPDRSTIYVPDESVGEYKAHTNWAKYADKIKPLSEYQPNNE